MTAPLPPAMVAVAIHIGPVADVPATGSDSWWDRPWRTGFAKQAVRRPVGLDINGLEGDAQADTLNHGGPDKAVCAYPSEHLPRWRTELELPGFAAGGFGENFTLAGAVEDQVCIGDVFRVGTAVVQVSQPRQPCWKLARRWRILDLAARVEQSGRTGWYFRVLEPGLVSAGDTLVPVDRPHPDWTVSRANRVMHQLRDDRDAAGRLARCPALSASWQRTLTSRAEGGTPPEGTDPIRRSGTPAP